MPERVIDSANNSHLTDLKVEINSLRNSGVYRVTIEKLGEERNLEQNALYWVGYVQPFYEWLVDLGNSHYTPYIAHKILAAMFLQELVANPITGEEMTATRSTTKLTKKQFSEFLDKISAFFVNECGITRFGSNRDSF